MRTPLVVVAALSFVTVATACREAGADRSAETAGAEAHRLVAQGALLLDVRTPEEFAAGHIAGAVNIPLQQLQARLGEVPLDRQIVVYCYSGGRSAAAAGLLRSAGRRRVFDLGPMSAWGA